MRHAREMGVTYVEAFLSMLANERKASALRLLQSVTDIRTVRELLGHLDFSTTMIYTHVLKVAACGTASPLDLLLQV